MITTNPSTVIGQDYAGMDDAGAVNEIAVNGNGFLVVRNPWTNETYATPAGNFSLDCNCCLVSETGARLQGRASGASSTAGDIQINAAGAPPDSAPGASLMCYSIDTRGKITVHLSDGTSFVRGEIMLQNFQDPEALVCDGDNLYSNMAAAGPLPALATPGSNGLGAIQWGVLELSHAGSTIWTN
jgi:flagellar basal-body rod protein FlgG